jgi:hypothetical protein
MREIDAGLLTSEPFDPAQAAAEAAEEQAAAQAVAAADPFASGEDSE